MRVAILINANAGGLDPATCEARASEILAGCRARGIEATAHLCDPARLTALARRLAHGGGLDAVVAAGGDGTVSAVAAGLVDSDVPLGIVPLGTLNHFAKDLGIADVATGLDALASQRTAEVDVGEVNGRVFVNNASVGLYPRIVATRDHERRAHGRRKWSAMIRAALRIALRFPLLHVALALAGRVVAARTPFVLVGNNEYETRLGGLGRRRHLDHGTLGVYTIRETRRARMLWVVLRGLFARTPPELEVFAVDRAELVANRRSLPVAVDGEVVRMAPPLSFRTRPGALRVLAPEAA